MARGMLRLRWQWCLTLAALGVLAIASSAVTGSALAKPTPRGKFRKAAPADAAMAPDAGMPSDGAMEADASMPAGDDGMPAAGASPRRAASLPPVEDFLSLPGDPPAKPLLIVDAFRVDGPITAEQAAAMKQASLKKPKPRPTARQKPRGGEMAP